MAGKQLPSEFSLPPRQPEHAEGVRGGTPAKLIAWINGVSVDDVPAAAARLLDAARILNRTEIGHPELQELTILLEARARPILELLDGQLRDLYPPLDSDVEALAGIYADLLQELAISNLRLAEEFLGHERISVPDIGLYLRRALLLTGCQCLHCWRLYEVEPEGTWLRIHRILAVAERLDLVSDPGTAEEGGLAFLPDSIERIAARIGILAASNVWALQQGEIGVLTRWIQSVPVKYAAAPAAESDVPRATSRLRMLLDEDQAPSLILGPPLSGTEARYIDLEPVLAALRASPPESDGGSTPGAERLDRRLRKRWVIPLANQFEYGPAHAGPMVSVTGLQESHALMRTDFGCQRSAMSVAGDLMPGGFFAPAADDPLGIPETFKAGLSAPDPGDQTSIGGKGPLAQPNIDWLSPRRLQHVRDAWTAAEREVDRPSHLQDLEEPNEEEPRENVNVEPTCAWLKNVGAGQVCVQLQAPAQRISGGDLIALRMVDQQRILWKPGVIRWLRCDREGNVTVGAEYLAHACWPIDIRLVDYVTPVDVVHPALFFRQPGKVGVGALLFASNTFALGAHLAFDLVGRQHGVTLKSVRPVSHALSLTEFALPRTLDLRAK
jgi:cyclic-di-GMP-binding protein